MKIAEIVKTRTTDDQSIKLTSKKSKRRVCAKIETSTYNAGGYKPIPLFYLYTYTLYRRSFNPSKMQERSYRLWFKKCYFKNLIRQNFIYYLLHACCIYVHPQFFAITKIFSQNIANCMKQTTTLKTS